MSTREKKYHSTDYRIYRFKDGKKKIKFRYQTRRNILDVSNYIKTVQKLF